MDPYNLIDIDTPQMSPRLKFKEFPDHLSSDPSKVDVDFPQSQSYNEPVNPTPKKSPWSLEFYQQLFDVNTEDVVARIKWSMIPHKNYFQQFIQTKPDLYGPFWISVTLVFTIAISGNMANYLQTAASQHYHWKYDFHVVSLAATAIISYAWVLPLCIWASLKWFGPEQATLNLLELVCIYGYCLSVYIPISVLWIIQINWFQWLLVLFGATLSGSVLLPSVYPLLGAKKIPLSLLMGVLHLLLAASFMLYFFHAPDMTITIKKPHNDSLTS